MDKIKNFFASPLRSSLFTAFIVLVIVFSAFMINRENNKLISFSDAEEIAMKDMGLDYFDDYNKVKIPGGSIDCFADGTHYYKLKVICSDGYDYVYFINAENGSVITSAKQESEESF